MYIRILCTVIVLVLRTPIQLTTHNHNEVNYGYIRGTPSTEHKPNPHPSSQQHHHHQHHHQQRTNTEPRSMIDFPATHRSRHRVQAPLPTNLRPLSLPPLSSLTSLSSPSYHIISYYIISYHYHIISYHYHIISYHIISTYPFSHLIISSNLSYTLLPHPTINQPINQSINQAT